VDRGPRDEVSRRFASGAWVASLGVICSRTVPTFDAEVEWLENDAEIGKTVDCLGVADAQGGEAVLDL